MTLKHLLYISIIILGLTSCGAIGGCSFSSADIQNQTDKDIYVIITFNQTDNKAPDADMFLKFESTELSDIVGKDSIRNSRTFRIKSKGKLTLYEGPGTKPKFFFNSLKIITDKVISEYKSVDEFAAVLEGHGIQNSLIFK